MEGSGPDRPLRLVDRAARVQRRSGLAGLLREGLDQGLRRLVSLHLLRALALESGRARPQAVDPAFVLGWLDPDRVSAFAADPSHRLGPGFASRARAGHDLCFAALQGDRLASYAWLALGSVEGEHAAGADLALPPDTAYLYKGFTHPDFRGRRLYPACLAAALAALEHRGVRRLVAFVYWSNTAGLRGCERAGASRLGWLLVGPRGPLRVPAEARRLGLGFGAEAAEALAARGR